MGLPSARRVATSSGLLQGWAAADPLTDGEICEPVTCTACGRIHLVNAKSGKVLDAAKK
jgi:hypothetical protein